MHASPEITVIITTFNRPALVPLAINSVLAQTVPAAGIIVVDDGSEQDMREVLASYGSQIHVIRQDNSGPGGARNTGVRAAATEWVSFLDDDDEYKSDRLARAAESIRRHPASPAHLSNVAIVSEKEPDINLWEARRMPMDDWMEVARPLAWVLRGCFFAQCLVVRRTVLHDIGLFRPTFYEDMDLFVRLAVRTPWIMDGRPCLRLIRRDNTNAISDEWRSKPIKRCEALVRIHREALAIAATDQEERLVRNGLGTYLFGLGEAYKGNPAEARRCFLEAARTFPAMRSRAKAVVAAVAGRPVISLQRAFGRDRHTVIR
jgi:glycosyltransferase involved in cell wall biosynthesis